MRFPVWSMTEKADLATPQGLLCGACHYPGKWHASRPEHEGGNHLVVHSGRMWPCTVHRNDSEVKRVLNEMLQLAAERYRNRDVESEPVAAALAP
jgi:hypothetical protein